MATAGAETALHTRLAGFAGLTALVAQRIYATKPPQNATYPAVSHFGLPGQKYSAMGADAAVASRRFQVSSWGDTKSAALDVATQVRKALQRFRGTSDGIVVQDVFVVSDGLDLYEPDTFKHQIVQEYLMWYVEP